MANDIVKEAMEAFKIADDAENHNRLAAKEDIEFSLLDLQWPEAIKRQRELEGRPCLTINRVKPVIRQVVNDSRQNRPSIKVHPCDSGADPETAEIISGIIRNIEASSDADVAYDTAIESAVSGGFGYWKINTDYAMNALSEDGLQQVGASAFEQDICIKRVANPFSIYGDPYSTAADSSDWMTAFEVEKLTGDEFKKKYPGADKSDFEGDDWIGVNAPWKEGENVQVASYWKREAVEKDAVLLINPETQETLVLFADDKAVQEAVALGAQVVGQRKVRTHKVTQHVLSGAEELEKKNWAGAYIPIVPVYGEEVNLLGKRYFRSLIRSAKDAQQMANYWDTVATEAVALAPRTPFVGRKGFAKGTEAKWATANSASHAYLEYDGPERPTREQSAQVPTGMLQMLAQSTDNIKAITGVYDASLGARSNETSGRAIMARQREGDVSTFHFIDNLQRAIRHSGRILIDLIPKVYSTERIVRILGEDGSPKTEKINGEEANEQGRIHDVRTGRYDLTVTSGPSFTSRREEAATQMIELIRAYPDAAPIIGDLLAKNLDWPGADEIAKRLEKMLPPQARGEEGGPDPAIMEQMQQMTQHIEMLMGKLQEAEQDKSLEQRKLDIEKYKAETDRIQAVPGVESIQAIVVQTLRDVLGQDLPNEEVAQPEPSSFEQPQVGQAY